MVAACHQWVREDVPDFARLIGRYWESSGAALGVGFESEFEEWEKNGGVPSTGFEIVGEQGHASYRSGFESGLRVGMIGSCDLSLSTFVCTHWQCWFCVSSALVVRSAILRFFSHGVLFVKFLCAPVFVCLKGP